jgi:hypothetical protein
MKMLEPITAPRPRGRLQKAEALGADSKDVAGENRQHRVVETENRAESLHDRKPENNRPRDDIRKSLLSFTKKVAPFFRRWR